MDNKIFENIFARRSTRKYKPDKIPKEIIEKLIEAGKYAPSSHNSQPWRFIVITNKVEIQKLSLYIKKRFKKFLWLLKIASIFSPNQRTFLESIKNRINNSDDLFFYKAPLLILICAKKNRWAQKDCSCAAQNIMLAARSLDIGSCWIGFADVALNTRYIRKILKIPDLKIFATLSLGYPVSFPENAYPRNKEAKIINWVK